MTEKLHDTSLSNYFYSEQLERYFIQFMAIFVGLRVEFGKSGVPSDTNLVRVPIRYASSDRVVDHIISENTQNKMLRLPMMSAHMTGLFLAPERRKGTGAIQRNVSLRRGGAMPDDLINTVKRTPTPYQLNMELSLYVSNQKQHMQLLEQVLVLFDPTLQIQTSDDSLDWTKITVVELMDIALEQNHPTGTTKRLITTNLAFKMPIWLSQPANLKTNIVNKIKLRLEAISGATTVDDAVCDMNQNTTTDDFLINIDDLDMPEN